jgi:hypothetical protein
LKEENILVQSIMGSDPHAVLLDLGGAQSVASTGTESDSMTIFVSTRKATRPGRVPYLGQLVSRKQLALWGEDLDLYAVGIMMDRALKAQKGRLLKQAEVTMGKSGRVALEWVVERLTEGDSDSAMDKRHYKSAGEVLMDLKCLSPGYTWPLGLQELDIFGGPASTQLPGDSVRLTPDLLRIVNHPMFQRLQNIPQLEYAFLVYPGARYSRFQHSLSAFNLCRTFLARLLDFPEFRMVAKPDYVQASLLVALTHDIGHYPLSHIFEDFAEDTEDISEVSDGKIPSHEALFRTMVCPRPGDRYYDIVLREFQRLQSIYPRISQEPLDALIRSCYSN